MAKLPEFSHEIDRRRLLDVGSGCDPLSGDWPH